MRRIPAWLPALPVLSFLLLVGPALAASRTDSTARAGDAGINPSVFGFSRNRNLLHLLADGFQGDVVRQVLEESPELAASFEGFTLFTDHVGTYQGTAPALYTLLTGRPFPLERGFSYDWVTPDVRATSYPKKLLEAGWQVDYVPISGFICVDGANSCNARPFNDMKARGLIRHHHEDVLYSARLIADLSLFRLAPMYLKEKIYNDGRWLLADTTLDGSSPYPGPVLREWTDKMHVGGDRPVYKWYHFIGTHIPAKWGPDCGLLEQPGRTRELYLGQARCVLHDIAGLLDRLREADIYDQTAIIISGDHGFNIPPDDMRSPALNGSMFDGLLGTGRPALLIKQVGNAMPLQFSRLPTWLPDVAPTALELAGFDSAGLSAFQIPPDSERVRLFRNYSIPDLWTGLPIPSVEYGVGCPANEGSNWRVTAIDDNRDAPTAYEPLNLATGKGFVLGAGLREEPGKDQSSWVTGRQLAFVLGLDEPARPRTLELKIRIPKWVPRQSFTVEFNGSPAWSSSAIEFDPGISWRTFSIPLDPACQKPGRNFVSVLFADVYHPPGNDAWSAAALVESIRVSENAAASAQPRAHQ